MRCRVLLLAALVALLGVSAAHAQQFKSPAELMPAKAVAYAEIRQPGQLAKEVASLFAGTVLSNLPDSLAELRARHAKDGFGRRGEELGIIGMVLSPEVVKEVGRIKGAAVAWTGLDKKGEPEFVAVVLPGDSAAPPFLMRMFLTTAPVRPIDKVEGVSLYQMYSPVFAKKVENKGDGKEQPGGPPPEGPQMHPFGPTFAMMPGALFVGSPGAVQDARRRAKGKGEGEALAGSAVFQEATKEAGNLPGLFAYANVANALELFEKSAHVPPDAREALTAVKNLINPKAFRAIAYSVTLSKGTLSYRELALLDPKEKSPVLELLPTAPVRTEVLHFAPADAMVVAALSNDNGEKRWDSFLGFIDNLAKLTGAQKHLPSEDIRELEKNLQINFGKDIAGKLSTIAFAVGDPLKAPVKRTVEKGPGGEVVHVGPEIPAVLILQATDEKAAESMMGNLVPQVFGMMTGQKDLKPASKDVNGQKVYSLEAGPHKSLHYGRHGDTLVLGPFQNSVAQALAGGAGKKGWLGNPKMAARVKETENPVALVVVKPVTAIMSGMMLVVSTRSVKPPPPPQPEKQLDPPPAVKPPQPPALGEVKQPGGGKQPLPPVKEGGGPPGLDKDGDQMMKELGKLLAAEEPFIFSLTRKEDRVQVEARMSGLKPLVGKLTNFMVEQYFKLRAGPAAGFGPKPGGPPAIQNPPPRPDPGPQVGPKGN